MASGVGVSEKIIHLSDLGLVWNPFEAQCEEGFGHLTAYKKEFGDCLVLGKSQYCDYGLGTLVGTQRSVKKNITPDQVNPLDELGFVWDAIEHRWEEEFKHLVTYKEEFGDYLVRDKTLYHDYRLGQWISVRRVVKDHKHSVQLESQ